MALKRFVTNKIIDAEEHCRDERRQNTIHNYRNSAVFITHTYDHHLSYYGSTSQTSVAASPCYCISAYHFPVKCFDPTCL